MIIRSFCTFRPVYSSPLIAKLNCTKKKMSLEHRTVTLQTNHGTITFLCDLKFVIHLYQIWKNACEEIWIVSIIFLLFRIKIRIFKRLLNPKLKKYFLGQNTLATFKEYKRRYTILLEQIFMWEISKIIITRKFFFSRYRTLPLNHISSFLVIFSYIFKE